MDDVETAVQEVTVPPGASEIVNLPVPVDTPGNHSISLNGIEENLTVNEPPEKSAPFDWRIIAIILAVLFIGLPTFFIMRRTFKVTKT